MRFATAIDPEVVVIVVTGYASTATAIDALRQGAYDYVTKPFDLDEVQRRSSSAASPTAACGRSTAQLVEELQPEERDPRAITSRSCASGSGSRPGR